MKRIAIVSLLMGLCGCGGAAVIHSRLRAGTKAVLIHPCDENVVGYASIPPAGVGATKKAEGEVSIPVGLHIEVVRDDEETVLSARPCEKSGASPKEYDVHLVEILALDGERKGQHISVPRYAIRPE
jgi:hypothetical protein